MANDKSNGAEADGAGARRRRGLFCLARGIAGCLGVMALAGCYPSLPKDLASLEPLSSCPAWKSSELEAKARHFGYQTDLLTLRCALGQLRGMKLADVHKTPIPAKLCTLLAMRFADNPAMQAQLAAEGVRWAEIAQADRKPPDGEIQYYYGVNLGMSVSDPNGLSAKLRSSRIQALESAARLVPQVDRGGPLRALGTLYLLAPLPPAGVGDLDRALELLKRAADQYPDHPQNPFLYAKALWQTEQNAARAEISKRLHQTEQSLAEKEYAEVSEQWRMELKRFSEGIGIAPNEPPPKPVPPPPKRRR